MCRTIEIRRISGTANWLTDIADRDNNRILHIYIGIRNTAASYRFQLTPTECAFCGVFVIPQIGPMLPTQYT